MKARVTVLFLRRFKVDRVTEAYLRRSLRNRKGTKIRIVTDPGSDDNEGGGSGRMGGEYGLQVFVYIVPKI